MNNRARASLTITALSLFVLGTSANAALYNGVEFPQGAASFADAVANFSPGPGPAAAFLDQNQSLGSVLKEPKLIGAAIALLIYGAYFVLRGSFTDMDKKARVSAVYNIFAFAMLFPSIWIIPRLVGSLHPGAPGSDSGNPALNAQKDLDAGMRMIFYPAVIGWTLLGVWIATLRIRIQLLNDKTLLND